nr:glycosyltransferase [Actinomycetota bacterium]
SIASQTLSPVETLVIDNGSNDSSELVVRRHSAQWHPVGRNIGLAPAMQLGATRARGETLLFLNNDVVFGPSFLEDLVAARLRFPTALAIDAVQRDLEGKLVHGVVGFRRTPFRLRGDFPGWFLEVALPAEDASPTALASAANLFVEREDFLAAGGWDTGFFLGHEDLDLCWRAWALGREMILDPAVECRHDVGATSRTRLGRQARIYGTTSGRLRFAAKHLPFEHALTVVAFALVGIPFAAARGELRPRLRALIQFTQSLPAILQARRAFYRGAGTTPRRHFKFMTSKFAAPRAR